jgi:hypothetical protein
MAITSPTYYRFVISRSTGDCSLTHDREGHPADIKVHDDLKVERPEQDLVNGYAIKKPNGWHLFDEDDKEIRDPFLITKVKEMIGEFEC